MELIIKEFSLRREKINHLYLIYFNYTPYAAVEGTQGEEEKLGK